MANEIEEEAKALHTDTVKASECIALDKGRWNFEPNWENVSEKDRIRYMILAAGVINRRKLWKEKLDGE